MSGGGPCEVAVLPTAFASTWLWPASGSSSGPPSTRLRYVPGVRFLRLTLRFSLLLLLLLLPLCLLLEKKEATNIILMLVAFFLACQDFWEKAGPFIFLPAPFSLSLFFLFLSFLSLCLSVSLSFTGGY